MGQTHPDGATGGDTVKKPNCWEFRKCGRSPEKPDMAGIGVCPAPLATKADGINGGKNGGRVCWAVAGTMCEGEVMGNYANKMPTCLECEFCKLVLQQEKTDIHVDEETLDKLQQ